MGKRLAQAGAIIALVGGAIGSVGAVVLLLPTLYSYVWDPRIPIWLGRLDILIGVGVAIFTVGAGLSLWALASGLPSQK